MFLYPQNRQKPGSLVCNKVKKDIFGYERSWSVNYAHKSWCFVGMRDVDERVYPKVEIIM